MTLEEKKAKELYDERALNFVRTCNHIEPDYVPILGSVLTWPVGYYHMDLREMLTRPEELAEGFCRIFDEVRFDVSHICGISTSIRTLEALGSDTFFISPDGTTIQHEERCFMEPSDYDELIKDPEKFMVDELGKRKLPRLEKGDEDSYATLVAAAKEQMVFGRINSSIGKIMTQRYGIVPVYGKSKVYPPFDYIFDRLRGFAGTMTDVRRNRAKLLEATNVMYEYVKGWVGGAVNQIGTGGVVEGGGIMEGFPYAVSTLHCPTFMRPNDFAELYFPTFKLLVEAVYNNGSKTVLFNEGSWAKFNDIMKDLPKGATVSMLDEDDPIEYKKDMGEWTTVCGGVHVATLKSESKEYCIDEAKRLLDSCAPGGGFVFSTDKSLCSGNDVNIDVFRAVNEFVHEYRG